MQRTTTLFLLLTVAALSLAACASGDTSAPDLLAGADARATATLTPAPRLRVEVVERLGHDERAFTQGLEFHQGRLFESRGRLGTSGLSEIDPATGEVLRWRPFDSEIFGEGLTVVDDRIIVLTWRNEKAFVYDLESFELVDTLSYDGEGWGLCHDGTSLWMSNGSADLTRRDPVTFAAAETVRVTHDGEPVPFLNELECVEDRVYANVWKQDALVVIDPADGAVESVIDARGLLGAAESEEVDVLNGIAHDPDTGRFVITGKLWPAMFEVVFVPA